jgi:hypothetical protein
VGEVGAPGAACSRSRRARHASSICCCCCALCWPERLYRWQPGSALRHQGAARRPAAALTPEAHGVLQLVGVGKQVWWQVLQQRHLRGTRQGTPPELERIARPPAARGGCRRAGAHLAVGAPLLRLPRRQVVRQGTVEALAAGRSGSTRRGAQVRPGGGRPGRRAGERQRIRACWGSCAGRRRAAAHPSSRRCSRYSLDQEAADGAAQPGSSCSAAAASCCTAGRRAGGPGGAGGRVGCAGALRARWGARRPAGGARSPARPRTLHRDDVPERP